MLWFFYFLAVISVISTLCVILQRNPIYSLLYLIISFLSISGIFFILGSFFAAALEVIIYTGAIMLLFVFIIMMLNHRILVDNQEKKWFQSVFLIISGIVSTILLTELVFIISVLKEQKILFAVVNTKQIGISLFGPYLIIVELSSILLLATLVVIYHLGKNNKVQELAYVTEIREFSKRNKKEIKTL